MEIKSITYINLILVKVLVVKLKQYDKIKVNTHSLFLTVKGVKNTYLR